MKRNLVKEEQLTGKVGYVMTVARTLLRAPFAEIEVDTPYFSGKVEVLCLKDPLYDLIIGNIPGARAPDDPEKDWGVDSSIVAQKQTKLSTETKPCDSAEVLEQLAVAKRQIVELQNQVFSLSSRIESKEKPEKRQEKKDNSEVVAIQMS